MNREQTIQRALEYLACDVRARDCLQSPQAVKDYVRLRIGDRAHEVFMVLFLESQNRLVAAEEMFRGTLSQTSVYPREVVIEALTEACCKRHPEPQPPVRCHRAIGRGSGTDAGAQAVAGTRGRTRPRPRHRRWFRRNELCRAGPAVAAQVRRCQPGGCGLQRILLPSTCPIMAGTRARREHEDRCMEHGASDS